MHILSFPALKVKPSRIIVLITFITDTYSALNDVTEPFFTEKTFLFLEHLAKNNQRLWFNDHKMQYEEFVREPALNFINEMSPYMQDLSPHFSSLSKKTGGALMRIHRDIRFSHDKTPYKTHLGIQFRHRINKDAHAPKFWLNISPTSCYLGVGAWRPHSLALSKIREMISDNPHAWERITTDKAFCRHFQLAGESLKTYPRGYSKTHPMIQHLKRKDFIAINYLSRADILNPDLAKTMYKRFKLASDFVEYVCDALELPYSNSNEEP